MSGLSKSSKRFRPDMEQLERREAPAAITAPDFYTVRSGRTLNQTRLNRNGVAGVLRNDYDDTQGTPPPFRNAGMTATLLTAPRDVVTGIFITTPFNFSTNGGFTFRAPRNFNGPVVFTYSARTLDGSVSAATPAIINVIGPIRRVAIAADSGTNASPVVTVYDATTKAQLFVFNAFDPSFHGGVRVATGDFNGDNVDDIVVAAGGGADPHVTIFDGQGRGEIASFDAFSAGFRGGVNVSVGDLNGDGVDDLIVSAGAGGDAHVKVFDGTRVLSSAGFDPNDPTAVLASFYAYGKGTTDGVRTAVGDIDGDGNNKLITAPAKGSPVVEAFDLSSGAAVQTKSFYAGNPTDNRGLFITAGDFNGDFFDDIAVGSGSGIPEARIYAGIAGNGTAMPLERSLSAATYSDSFATDSFQNPFTENPQPGYLVGTLTPAVGTPNSFVGGATTPEPGDFGGLLGGMRVGVDYANLDNNADLILAQGPGGYSRFQILSGVDLSTLVDLTVYTGFYGGINVAGHY